MKKLKIQKIEKKKIQKKGKSKKIEKGKVQKNIEKNWQSEVSPEEKEEI